nr:MAG TPA: hypothetical protein [Caudoviricetes sp.]
MWFHFFYLIEGKESREENSILIYLSNTHLTHLYNYQMNVNQSYLINLKIKYLT